MARYGSAWVSGLALLLIAGIGGCEVRGVPFTGGAGRTAGPVTVYVANEGDGTVTPIRAASHAAGRPIRVGPAPALIAISPMARPRMWSASAVSCPMRRLRSR